MTAVERVQRIFRDALVMEVPMNGTDILESGMLDSLTLVTLIFEVEQEFGVVVPLETMDIDDLRTVDRIAGLAERLQEAQREGSHP
jgi:acyl carrier protein